MVPIGGAPPSGSIVALVGGRQFVATRRACPGDAHRGAPLGGRLGGGLAGGTGPVALDVFARQYLPPEVEAPGVAAPGWCRSRLA